MSGKWWNQIIPGVKVLATMFLYISQLYLTGERRTDINTWIKILKPSASPEIGSWQIKMNTLHCLSYFPSEPTLIKSDFIHDSYNDKLKLYHKQFQADIDTLSHTTETLMINQTKTSFVVKQMSSSKPLTFFFFKQPWIIISVLGRSLGLCSHWFQLPPWVPASPEQSAFSSHPLSMGMILAGSDGQKEL